jgi:Asp/Glu/hydantoin racemase
MRLLVYNPNTNQALTTALGNAVQQLLRPDDVLETATSDSGEVFIGSDKSVAAARAALQTDLPRRALDCDAILLGCFGDLGVDEIRRELRRPIVSLSDAFFATAPFLGRRIGLLTTSAYWAGRLAVEASRKGAFHWIVETRSLEIPPDESSVSLEARCRSVMAEVAKDGRCEAVVLAGAMLTALSRELAHASPLLFVDPLAAGIALCRIACETLTSRQRVA